jgi:hypothetical protein
MVPSKLKTENAISTDAEVNIQFLKLRAELLLSTVFIMSFRSTTRQKKL